MDSSQPQAKTLPGNLWSFVWRYMKVRKLFIAAMLFVGIAWSVEMVTKPYLLKIIIDTATGSSNNSAFSTIMLLGLIYLVVMFVGVLVTNFYNYVYPMLYNGLFLCP